MQEHLENMKNEIESGEAQLFDVREQNEWDEGHLTSARLVPLSACQEGDVDNELDRSKKTYLHCRSGNRVYMAAPLLADLGFDNIVPVDEGFDQLVLEGFEQADS